VGFLILSGGRLLRQQPLRPKILEEGLEVMLKMLSRVRERLKHLRPHEIIHLFEPTEFQSNKVVNHVFITVPRGGGIRHI